MRFVRAAILAIFIIYAPASAADDVQLEVGQAWSFKDAPTADARVVIGKIEQEFDPGIVHVLVEGLPDLDRSPGPLREGITGRGAGRHENRFWCQYELTPKADYTNVAIRIFYMPIEYDALAGSLVSLEENNVAIDGSFEYAYDNWDYFRDQYETEGTHAAIATKPLSESIEMVMKSARSTLAMMKRIQPEIERLRQEGKVN